MKIRSLAALLTALLSISPLLAHAHPGGHGPISADEAKELASVTAQELTQRDAGLGFGQLEQSWNEVPASQVSIHQQTSTYFIVSIRNDAVDKTLYVLISTLGEVYDANMTGTFEGLVDEDTADPESDAPGTPSP